jgi:pilus assembly protein Flp/PilA
MKREQQAREVVSMTDWVLAKLCGFVHEEQGDTAVEYAMMLVLIIMVCIVTVAFLGRTTEGTFNTFLTTYDSLAPK